MFDISERYKLMIYAPTFKYDVADAAKAAKAAKAAPHRIMQSRNRNTLRYVNFIDSSVPLFNRYALDKLMKYYDPALMDTGIDYLYIWACGESIADKYALVDNVTYSELSILRRNGSNRNSIWDKFAKKWGIKHGKETHREWKTIPLK